MRDDVFVLIRIRRGEMMFSIMIMCGYMFYILIFLKKEINRFTDFNWRFGVLKMKNRN